jgi:hypothetical protein
MFGSSPTFPGSAVTLLRHARCAVRVKQHCQSAMSTQSAGREVRRWSEIHDRAKIHISPSGGCHFSQGTRLIRQQRLLGEKCSVRQRIKALRISPERPRSYEPDCKLEVEGPTENHRTSSASGRNVAKGAASQAQASLRKERMIEPVGSLSVEAHVHALREADVTRPQHLVAGLDFAPIRAATPKAKQREVPRFLLTGFQETVAAIGSGCRHIRSSVLPGKGTGSGIRQTRKARPAPVYLRGSDLAPKTIQEHVDNVWVLGWSSSATSTTILSEKEANGYGSAANDRLRRRPAFVSWRRG